MGLGPLILRFKPGEPIFVRGRIRGPDGDASVRLLLDTGASRTLINPKRLTEVGVELEELPRVFTMATVSGTTRAPLITVPTLAVLGVLRRGFEVVAYALPPSAPIDGLLGLDFLVGLRLSIDMRIGEMTAVA